MKGLILFAHGARDPRWAAPFEALAAKVRDRAPELIVGLAYLEHLAPDLESALRAQAAQKVDTVRVVPLFFGRGGHLRDDFPRVLARARAAVPNVDVAVTEAAGEDDNVLEALAMFALKDYGGC
ncbi:MAG TPA: CbiX/SirB N-terminal domain-containing protein [Casimicrobiaceae bacterium]|nr:CbiX/SirB N-terminal domain-containing protein [Casimicrobiaceae bacterium]